MDYFRPCAFAADEKVVSAWDSQVAQAAGTPGFERALIERCGDLFPRFADCYAQLCALPRGARRALQRQLARSQELAAFLPELLQGMAGHPLQQKLARSLAGAALLLALGQGVAQAGVINVTPNTPNTINRYDGKCSLVEAIIAAHFDVNYAGCYGAVTSPDIIQLPPGTQKLLDFGYDKYYGAVGLPTIRSDITIQGTGTKSKIARDPDAPPFRIFAVAYDGKLTLNNVTVSGGVTNNGGGGIFNAGYLYVNNSTITGNTAGSGGAISNYFGYTQINNSKLTKNIADYGGAIYNVAYVAGYRGNVVVNNSTITGNKANNDGGGIYSNGNDHADVFINNSTISKNSAAISGGGVVNRYGSTYIENSLITGNKAGRYGGGLANFGPTAYLVVSHSTVSKNSTGYAGGGIVSAAGYTALYHSSITGNKATTFGGGVANFSVQGFANVGSIISKNKAPIGPDIYNR